MRITVNEEGQLSPAREACYSGTISEAACDVKPSPQPGLKIFRWLIARFPSWLSHHRPEHRRMTCRMFDRVTKEEGRE